MKYATLFTIDKDEDVKILTPYSLPQCYAQSSTSCDYFHGSIHVVLSD